MYVDNKKEDKNRIDYASHVSPVRFVELTLGDLILYHFKL